MVAILFCSAIALGCIEEAQEPATTDDGNSGELTHPATEEPHSLLVYCGAGMRKPMGIWHTDKLQLRWLKYAPFPDGTDTEGGRLHARSNILL